VLGQRADAGNAEEIEQFVKQTLLVLFDEGFSGGGHLLIIGLGGARTLRAVSELVPTQALRRSIPNGQLGIQLPSGRHFVIHHLFIAAMASVAKFLRRR
jgi:hypothetical protein